MPPVIGDQNVRRIFARVCERLDGSRHLVLALAGDGAMPWDRVRAARHRLTRRNPFALETLRRDLDGISAPWWWSAEAG